MSSKLAQKKREHSSNDFAFLLPLGHRSYAINVIAKLRRRALIWATKVAIGVSHNDSFTIFGTGRFQCDGRARCPLRIILAVLADDHSQPLYDVFR